MILITPLKIKCYIFLFSLIYMFPSYAYVPRIEFMFDSSTELMEHMLCQIDLSNFNSKAGKY